MTTTEYTPAELATIAATIKAQITMPSMMEVGARQFVYGNFTLAGIPTLPGLRFTAKPRHRLVDVYVLLDPSDTYRVIVRKRNVHVPTSLYEVENIYADSLATVIRRLSYKV